MERLTYKFPTLTLANFAANAVRKDGVGVVTGSQNGFVTVETGDASAVKKIAESVRGHEVLREAVAAPAAPVRPSNPTVANLVNYKVPMSFIKQYPTLKKRKQSMPGSRIMWSKDDNDLDVIVAKDIPSYMKDGWVIIENFNEATMEVEVLEEAKTKLTPDQLKKVHTGVAAQMQAKKSAKKEEIEEEEEEEIVKEAKTKYLTGPGKKDSKRLIGIYTMNGKWVKDMGSEAEAKNFVNKNWREGWGEESEEFVEDGEINEAKFSTNDLLDSIESAYKKGGLKGVIQGGKEFGLTDRTTVGDLLNSAKSMFGSDIKKAAAEIKGFLKPQDYAKYKSRMESVELEGEALNEQFGTDGTFATARFDGEQSTVPVFCVTLNHKQYAAYGAKENMGSWSLFPVMATEDKNLVISKEAIATDVSAKNLFNRLYAGLISIHENFVASKTLSEDYKATLKGVRKVKIVKPVAFAKLDVGTTYTLMYDTSYMGEPMYRLAATGKKQSGRISGKKIAKAIESGLAQGLKEEVEQIDELTGGEAMMYTMASFVLLYPDMPPMMIAKFLASQAADKFKSLISKVKSKKQITPDEKTTLKTAIKGAKEEVELDEAKPLIGGQKKLDANKNGKLDAHDFKLLRAKKAAKEETEVTEAMNNYIAFYNGKKMTIQAETSYKAQLKAAEMLKVPASKRYMITVKLADNKNA